MVRNYIKKIGLHSVLYSLGDFLVIGFGVILIPFYTIYLAPSDYGIINYLLAINSFILPFVSLTILSALPLKFFDFKNPERFKTFLSTLMYFAMFFGAAFLAILLAIEYAFPVLSTEDIPFYPLLFLSIGTCLFNQFIQVPLRLFNCQERPLAYSFFNIANFLIGIVLLIWFIAFMKEGVWGNVKALFIRDAIMFGLVLLIVSKHMVFRFSWTLLKESMKLTIPLIPHTLSAAALTLLDRILLAHLDTLESVGLYSLSYQISGVLVIIGGAISVSIYPVFFKLNKSKVKNAKSLSARLMTLSIYAFLFISLALILFTREFIWLLATEAYYSAYIIVPVLALGGFFYFLYYLSTITISYVKKTSVFVVASLSSALLNLGLNYLLIPPMGQAGAAWATAASYGLMFLVIFYFSQRFMRLPFPILSLMSALAMAISLVLINFFWLESLPLSLMTMGGKAMLLFVFPVFLFAFRLVDSHELILFIKDRFSKSSST